MAANDVGSTEGDLGVHELPNPLVTTFALQCEITYVRALLALTARARASQGVEDLRDRLRRAEAQLMARGPALDPTTRLRAALDLDAVQVAFFWAAAAASGDPRLPVPLEEIGGANARHGLKRARRRCGPR